MERKSMRCQSALEVLLLFLAMLSACSTETKKETSATFNTANVSSDKTHSQFDKLTSDLTNIYFVNEVAEDRFRNILLYQYFYNGGGVAAGDIDNDGKTDLFFTGNTVANKLYRNQGAFKFEDITIAAGILPSGSASWCTGVTMADVNADGWLDIYVSRSGNLRPENRTNLLYINQQNGTFVEQAEKYGLADPGYSIQAAFFDFDRDGDLDMFLINHGMEYYGQIPKQEERGRDPFVGDKLYRNEEGRFVDISQEAGIDGSPESYGLGVSVADLNNDGWDDIYVANDFYEHDYLYINQGNLGGEGNNQPFFRESIHSATRQTSFFSMGVDIADFNNDGWQDIVVLDMAAEDQQRQKENMAGISQTKFRQLIEQGYHYQYMFNSLQLNRGPVPGEENLVAFSNIARLAGTAQTDWSWAPLLADFDNDGWKDLFITNGLRKDVLNNDFIAGFDQELEKMNTQFVNLAPAEAEQMLDKMPSEKVSNYFFHNNGDLTFQNKAAAWGLSEPTFSNGAVYADLDNDGDLDLVMNNLDDFASIYENDTDLSKRRYLRIKVKGNQQNPFGIGTKVTLYSSEMQQFQQLYPTRGYQSSVEPILHFGLGSSKEIDSVRIAWFDGKITLLKDIAGNQLITVDYQQAISTPKVNPTTVQPLIFKQVAHKLGLDFTHQESPYEDFDYEFLIPRKFSQEGPGLATGDVNGDGWEDIFVGGAKGQSGQLFLQTKQGDFKKAERQPWQEDAGSEDISALFFDADQDRDLDLYVGSGSNEFDSTSSFLQDRLYLNNGQGNFSKSNNCIPDIRINTSCVATGDFDQDGDLDLFVGGGVIPKSYPYASRSFLLENSEGKFTDVTEALAPALMPPGIVNDATWTDYNQDGQLDLIVVGEWMSPSFYKNQAGKLHLDTTSVKFEENGQTIAHSQLSGWWKCIAPIDVNQDGLTDYLVGNEGLNNRFRPTNQEPIEIFVGDFDKNGTSDIIMGYYQGGSLYPVHGREALSTQLPSIKKAYSNYASYAQATLPKIIQRFPASAHLHHRAYRSEHILLYNEGDANFRIEQLPIAVQASSIQAIEVQDFDLDGRPDALLAGNFYGTATSNPRDDAGVGMLLKGGSDQKLHAIPMRKSGFYVPHDARNITFIKNPQGSIVIVANNNTDLQIFRLEK